MNISILTIIGLMQWLKVYHQNLSYGNAIFLREVELIILVDKPQYKLYLKVKDLHEVLLGFH